MSYFRPVEILVILLVIISTASLDFKTEESELEYLEVEYIEGTLDLKTRSSMDSLGLNDFKPGALVELNLNVNSITSECQICKNKPVGVLLSGEVNVSGLRPIDSGGQIRIEGNLNVTHLQEFSSKDMIIREWLTIDWDLDEFSAQWDIFIEHNPPKWSLDNRYDASLVDSGDATKSRVGRGIYLEEIIENSINIHGCMPNSLNCDGVNREEMNLTTKLTTQTEPTNVVYSSNWTNNNDTPRRATPPVQEPELRRRYIPNLAIDLIGLSVGIPRTQGFATDILSLIGSLFLSLLPSWDPNGE